MEIAFDVATIAIALLGVGVAYFQLRRAADALERSAEANQLTAEANNISNLMAVLQLEENINQAGYRLLDAVKQYNTDPISQNGDYVKVCTERFLNAIDRFCQCIRSGIVDEDVYRRDYRQRIADAVEKNKEFFGPTTPFLHIQHIYQSWKADKSAVDMPKKLQGVAANKLALPQGD